MIYLIEKINSETRIIQILSGNSKESFGHEIAARGIVDQNSTIRVRESVLCFGILKTLSLIFVQRHFTANYHIITTLNDGLSSFWIWAACVRKLDKS